MRSTISTWIAVLAVTTAAAGAAPAMACGINPCAPGYSVGYGYAGTAVYERLPDPTPVTHQYYYVNQGPTFSGPGMLPPVQTYQETALGWRGYGPAYGYGYRYGYTGGPYANPVNYAVGPAYRGPAVYRYAPRMHVRARPSYRYGYNMQPRVHFGYAPRSYASRVGYQPMRHAGPKVMVAPRGGVYQRPQHH